MVRPRNVRRLKISIVAVLLPVAALIALAQFPITDVAVSRAKHDLTSAVPGIRFYEQGDKITRIYAKPFSEGETPVESADAFVSRYGDVFGLGDGNLVRTGTQDIMRGKFTAVYYEQRVGQLPVDLGNLTILVANRLGNPAVLASSNVQTVYRTYGDPRITNREAVEKVRRAAKDMVSFSDPGLVVYRGEADTHLAWSFIAWNGSDVNPRRFQMFVDAETGAILEWRDKAYTVDVTGNVQAAATPGLKPDQPNNPAQMMNLYDARVNITGGNIGYTNSAGNYVISNAGSSNVTVNSVMQGHWVRAVPAQGTTLSASLSVTPPGPANFVHNSSPTQFNTAQVNAQRQVTIVHDFAKSINPSYPGIDIQLTTNVNQNSTCNANYNGSSINFFAAGGGCPNTAYSTVIYHEYGHFIIDSGHPTAAGDYHEGMADVTANLLADTSWLGEDFRGQGTGPLRNAINNINYPCSGEVHTCGQVIAGAFWHTYQQLQTVMPQPDALALIRSLYLNSILLRPAGITPAITIDVLTLDDDNGDIYDGTPHYNQINAGFTMKNMPAPPLDSFKFIVNNAPGELVFWQMSRSVTQNFDFNIQNLNGSINPSTFKFRWRIDQGPWQERPIPAFGLNFSWKQAFVNGNVVSWYVTAQDSNGATLNWPRAGQSAPMITTYYTSLQPTFVDTAETNMGWSVQNVSLTAGAWVRADPNGTFLNGIPANPEDDSDDPGAQCFFTGQGTVGGAVGDADVDGGPTRLISPTIDMSDGSYILEFKRWFFNDDGDDTFVVELSNDNGTTWTQVSAIFFTGSQNQWTTVRIPIRAYINTTSQMKVRFSTADNPNNSITEAGVDNIQLKKVVTN